MTTGEPNPFDFGPPPARGDERSTGPYGPSSGAVGDVWTGTPSTPGWEMGAPGNWEHGGPAPTVTAPSPSAADVGSPPTLLLVPPLVMGVLGALVAYLLGETTVWAFVAWALAGPVAVALLAFYVYRDTRQRARAVYSGDATWLYWIALVAIGLGVVVSAWRIAQWAGQL